MTIPSILPTNIDVIVQKNFSAIREVLAGRLSIDNFNFQTISGTTSSSGPDEQKTFNHSMQPRPIAWFPLVGDVYVQEISDKYVDVRSTKPGVNFKIILIGGSPVTGETVASVGDDSYQNTTDLIEVTDIGIGSLNEFTFHPHPTLSSGASVINPTCVATDGDYFYITSTGTASNSLHRINRSDGSRRTLSVLSGVGAGKIIVKKEENKIYICSRVQSGGVIDIAEVQISDFTLTTTHSNTGAVTGLDPILEFTDDHSNFYIATSNPNVNLGTQLIKFAKGGGAPTVLALSTTTGTLAMGVCSASNGNIYVSEFDSSLGTSKIYEVTPATMAIANTITTAARRYRFGKLIEWEGYLLCPVVADSAKSATSSVLRYGSALVAIDLTTRTISEYPLPALHSGAATISTIPGNAVLKDNYLYLVSTAVTQGTSVFRINLLQREVDTRWYPIFSVASNTAWDTVLIKDSDGEPLLLYKPGTTDLDNFGYLSPSFPVGSNPINFIG